MIFSKKKRPVELVPYINNFARKSKKSRAYKRKFWNLARKLREYEEYREMTLFSDSFSIDIFEDFCIIIQSKHQYRLATLKAIQQQLNVILNLAAMHGNKVNFEYKDYHIRNEESFAVSLNQDEILKINALKNLSREAKVVRDIFITGCVTGLRFSDYSRLLCENIEGNLIRINTTKTKVEVKIPLHWMINEVLERNNGEFPKIKSQQAFNKMLKRICKKAGITDVILIERTVAGKLMKKKYRKYELIASHTARRSFATNLYLEGIPAAKIMLITGHKTEMSFFRYIRIDKEHNAKELADHPYFSQKTPEPLPRGKTNKTKPNVMKKEYHRSADFG